MEVEKLAQDGSPAEQAPELKEGNENQDMYKSFFEEAIQKDQDRRAAIVEQLSDSKLTDAQKFALEKEAFEIEKKLYSLGIKEPTKESVVESIVGIGLKPGDAQYNYIKDAIEGLPVDEAKNIINVFAEFMNIGKTTDPKSISGSPVGSGDKGQPIGFSSKDIVGEQGRAAKQNLVDLMSALAAKG